MRDSGILSVWGRKLRPERWSHIPKLMNPGIPRHSCDFRARPPAGSGRWGLLEAARQEAPRRQRGQGLWAGKLRVAGPHTCTHRTQRLDRELGLRVIICIWRDWAQGARPTRVPGPPGPSAGTWGYGPTSRAALRAVPGQGLPDVDPSTLSEPPEAALGCPGRREITGSCGVQNASHPTNSNAPAARPP